jgi:hypothetical protein
MLGIPIKENASYKTLAHGGKHKNSSTIVIEDVTHRLETMKVEGSSSCP